MPTLPLTAGQLRREINARAEAYARAHGLVHDLSPGAAPSVVFGPDERGSHGNFQPESFVRILSPACAAIATPCRHKPTSTHLSKRRIAAPR